MPMCAPVLSFVLHFLIESLDCPFAELGPYPLSRPLALDGELVCVVHELLSRLIALIHDGAPTAERPAH